MGFRLKKRGKCIQCGQKTTKTLANGVYACDDCLAQVGIETYKVSKYIDEVIKIMELNDISEEMFFAALFCILLCMENNNVGSISNAVKTLKAIEISRKFGNNTITPEMQKLFEKYIDNLYS